MQVGLRRVLDGIAEGAGADGAAPPPSATGPGAGAPSS